MFDIKKQKLKLFLYIGTSGTAKVLIDDNWRPPSLCEFTPS